MELPSSPTRGTHNKRVGVISKQELDRIKSSVVAPSLKDTESRRLSLKKKSEDRTAAWPDTVEAIRKRRENWKKEMEEKLEQERQRMDQLELQRQEEERSVVIEAAKRKVIEQTDLIKNLRTQQLLVDVLQDREQQIEERELKVEWQKRREQQWEEQVKKSIEEYDRNEKKKELIRKQGVNEVKASLDVQQEEFKQRQIQRLQEEKRQGEHVVQKSLEEQREDREAEEERRRQYRMASEATRQANLELQKLKQLEARKEEEEEESRKLIAEQKELMEQRKKAKAKERFDAQLMRKQKLIDAATENLLKIKKQNEEILENQVQETKAKEDREMQMREERRKNLEKAIDRSRRLQIDMKKQKKDQDVKEAEENARQWNVFLQEAAVDEVLEEQEKRLEAQELEAFRLMQARQRKVAKEIERADNLKTHEDMMKTMAHEKKLLEDAADLELEKAIHRGVKRMGPLLKARTTKPKDLMPVGGFKV